MKSYNKTFIVLLALLIGGLGFYMVKKLNYINKVNEEEETTEIVDESTTLRLPTSSTTSTTTIITSNTTNKTNTTKKTTTTTTTTSTAKIVPQNTTTTTTKSNNGDASSLASKNYQDANELLGYVNALRREVGVPELSLDTTLNVAASIRAIEMANYNKFSHERPNGSKAFTVLGEVNMKYKSFGENIAYASKGLSPKMAYDKWFGSQGHYNNMIDSSFTKMGASHATNNKGETYWAQIFWG